MLDNIIDVVPYQFVDVGNRSEFVIALFLTYKLPDEVTAIAAP